MATNEERSEATRARLLAIARKRFGTKGYAATSVGDLVRRAGVTKGAFYHHFDDKKSIFLAVLEEAQQRLAVASRAPLVRSPLRGCDDDRAREEASRGSRGGHPGGRRVAGRNACAEEAALGGAPDGSHAAVARKHVLTYLRPVCSDILSVCSSTNFEAAHEERAGRPAGAGAPGTAGLERPATGQRAADRRGPSRRRDARPLRRRARTGGRRRRSTDPGSGGRDRRPRGSRDPRGLRSAGRRLGPCRRRGDRRPRDGRSVGPQAREPPRCGDRSRRLPAYASRIEGGAQATLVGAELDPARDEAVAYGEKLRRAGVPVDVVRCDGMIHVFFALGGVLDRASEVMDHSAAALRAALE